MPLAHPLLHRIMWVMAELLLTPAANMEGQLSNFDFDVMADSQVVGRITLDLSGLIAAPHSNLIAAGQAAP
jgi:hypothetical protein